MTKESPTYSGRELQPKPRKRTTFEAEITSGSLSFPSEVVVWEKPPTIKQPTHIADMIKFSDPSMTSLTGRTPMDVTELNTSATRLANMLGNTYPTAEMLVMFPGSQKSVLEFLRMLEQNGFLGRITKASNYKFTGRTLVDQFFYEFKGPNWKRFPKVFLGQLVRAGDPWRDDMQFSIVRTPDYRVKADEVSQHFDQSNLDRAQSFTQALKKFSSGEITAKLMSR